MMSKEDLAFAASAQLQRVTDELKNLRKVMVRDWEALSPRERSAVARQIKTLETQETALNQELELLAAEINALS